MKISYGNNPPTMMATFSRSALLLLSYGAPETVAEVEPFLDKLLGGRRLPPKRLAEVIAKYQYVADLLGTCSPLQQECRQLAGVVDDELQKLGPKIPVYLANLYWYPLLEHTLELIQDDEIDTIYVFTPTVFDSPIAVPCTNPSGNTVSSITVPATAVVDRYTFAIEQLSPPLRVVRLPLCWNNPLFWSAQVDTLLDALAVARLECSQWNRPDQWRICFTVHGLPTSVAQQSDYCRQVKTACQEVAKLAHLDEDGFTWTLAWQSRSGTTAEEWLTPDINDLIGTWKDTDIRAVVVVPIGFFCENVETVYDLDVETARVAEANGIHYFRAACVGGSAKTGRMVRDLVAEIHGFV